MPDFSPSIYGSSNPYTAPQPVNQLTQLGNLVGIRNQLYQGQIAQQQVAQQQMATAQQQDNQKLDAYFSQQQQANPSGTPDLNQAGSWLAQNAPLAFQKWQAYKDGRLALTPQGVDPNTGFSISKPLQEQQSDLSNNTNASSGAGNAPAAPSSHVIQTGLAPGQAEAAVQSKTDAGLRMKAIDTDATNATNANPILSQIISLSKEGAPTGTATAKIYSFLSGKGLVDPASTVEKQREEINKYMEQQALVAGMPESDARLQLLHASNTNENLLPSAVQGLGSFLQAQNQGKILKQNYFRRPDQVGTGPADPNKQLAAEKFWNNNYDARLVEYNAQPDADAKKQYLRDHPDVIPLIRTKYKNLKNANVFTPQQ
jgi:hypothetical protein